jgi:phosphonate degradation associated HDIG domain protein
MVRCAGGPCKVNHAGMQKDELNMTRAPEQVTDEIFALLQASAQTDYVGEAVSQLEHALQCAKLAADAGGDDMTVLAALLHDIGHICAGESAARMDELGVVDHETIGGEFLRRRGFSHRVVALVQGHVEAKRYLTFKHPSYREGLSHASLGTLMHQGGPMSADEAAAFESDPLFEQKLRLRAWDEQGKRTDWQVPPLERYREMLVRHLSRNPKSSIRSTNSETMRKHE